MNMLHRCVKYTQQTYKQNSMCFFYCDFIFVSHPNPNTNNQLHGTKDEAIRKGWGPRAHQCRIFSFISTGRLGKVWPQKQLPLMGMTRNWGRTCLDDWLTNNYCPQPDKFWSIKTQMNYRCGSCLTAMWRACFWCICPTAEQCLTPQHQKQHSIQLQLLGNHVWDFIGSQHTPCVPPAVRWGQLSTQPKILDEL